MLLSASFCSGVMWCGLLPKSVLEIIILSRNILDHMELRTLQSPSAQLEFGKPSGLASINLKLAALSKTERSRMRNDPIGM